MSVYYNEFDPFAAAWLRELISAGVIPAGEVDTRSIIDVQASDLKSFTQQHFFAGIGGWALALHLAGWPEDRPVWTGSCPCQPFSTAGKQKGKADERHLWPIWFKLIREFQPPIIFGEQVAAAITKGWLDSVYDDLEKEGYAVGSAILPACSVEEKTGRERLWFVGHAEHNGLHTSPQPRGYGKANERAQERTLGTEQLTGASPPSVMADSENFVGDERECPYNNNKGWEEQGAIRADSSASGLQWIECPDGKARPIEPSLCLLANGIPNRVGKLRGYGNAIVPQVAAEFIKAYMSI